MAKKTRVLSKAQKEFIIKAFECPKEYGYMKDGKCIKHKMAKKPEGPSLRKSIARVGGVRKKYRKKKASKRLRDEGTRSNRRRDVFEGYDSE